MPTKRLTLVVAVLLASLAQASPAHADGFGGGAAAVACADLGVGAIARTKCVVPPTGSALYRSGRAAECDYPGTTDKGTVHWAETEYRIIPHLSIPSYEWYEIQQLNNYFLAHRMEYGGEVRWFYKQCQNPHGGGSYTLIDAFPWFFPITDPLLDIRVWVEGRTRQITLPVPELVTLPEPGPLGWLKVNSPAWLAVTPGSWRSVTTPTEIVNGWDVTLTVRPTVLAFTVDQGDARHAVACDVAAQRYVRGSARFPSEPEGFTAEPNWFDPPDRPLAPRDCVWTPRAKGDGTVTIAITYNVTAIAAGRVFEFAPRTQTVVAPIEVVELRVVNVSG